VYFVWHPNWQDGVATLKSQVGHPHPKMVIMLDVESWGGEITGNQSAGINAAFEDICTWLGDRRRVIGYGNQGDLDSLWPQRPAGIRLVVAKYSTTRPNYPGQIAHQYTDGSGYGSGPQGSAPFGNCDHNFAYDLDPHQFAAILGVGAAPMAEYDYTILGYEQLAGPRGTGDYGTGWPQLGQTPDGHNLTFVDALARVKNIVEGTTAMEAERVAPSSTPDVKVEEAAAAVPLGPRGEMILPYDHSIVPQETGYWCGPAATQVCLNGQGVFVSEQELANAMGTDTGGTDYIGLLEAQLDRFVPDRQYADVYTEQDPMSHDQKEALRRHLVDSIYGGCGVPMNWVVPAGNRPVAIKGSGTPTYGNKTTYHYVCAMGYDEAYPGGAVWIADSGFNPFGYWITFDQCATLIPPKGYTYATSPKNAVPPQPIAPPAPPDYERLEYEQLAGPVTEDGYGHGWPQLGGMSVTDALASIKNILETGGVPIPPGPEPEPPPVTGGKHALLTCSGTWAAPGVGYPSDVANACLDVIEEVPVQAPWSFGPITGGGQGKEAASYAESVEIGLDWACDWLLAHPNRTWMVGGYSQGGECAARIRQETLPGGRLESVAGNYVGGFAFGNPARHLEHAFHLCPARSGEGIAQFRMDLPGDEFADYVDPGDMYGAVPDNLTGEIMRDVYTMMTEMQLHDGFAEFARDLAANCAELLGNLDGDAYDAVMAQAQVQGVSFVGARYLPGAQLQLLAERHGRDADGMLSVKGISAAIAAAIRAITFFAQGTAPHIQYHMREVFPGQTYLQHAIGHVHYFAGTRVPTS
jgi:hypothetical protein